MARVELPDHVLPAPRRGNLPPAVPLRRMLGPSVVLVGLSIGSGEFVLWPRLTADFGFVVFWACWIGVTIQFFLNLEIERYSLATGESVVTGFVRLWRGFGLVFVVCASVPWIWPGWATGAATLVTWQVGDRPRDVTEDLSYTTEVLEWVRRQTLVDFDESRILIAGFSGGGSMVPYVATNSSPFTHAAVLHGRVFSGGLGRRNVRMWFSTGAQDDSAPVSELSVLVDRLRTLRFDVTDRTYAGGHSLGADEKLDLIGWWLGI